MTGSRAAATEGGVPPNAKIVLGTLILVAAVANLNLSVANVALPSIGASFDASQTALDLIAVGYSLGLAASVLWFGALGDRYGRKRMIVLGMLITIPASIVAAFAPIDRGPLRGPRGRRPLRRHGLPDDTGAHHGALVGPGPHALHRRCGPRSVAAWPCSGPLVSGLPAAVLRVGIGVPRHAAARASSRSTWPASTCLHTSTRRRSRWTTSVASSRRS